MKLKLLKTNGTVTIKASATTEGGEASPLKRFSMLAYTGAKMRFFGLSYILDLTGINAGKSRPIFLNHDSSVILGHTDKIQVDDSGLVVEGVLSGAASITQPIIESAANGFPWQASIGAMPTKIEKVTEGQEAKVNGQTVKGPLIIVRAADLKEISFVPLGADDNTSAYVKASGASMRKLTTSHMLLLAAFEKGRIPDSLSLSEEGIKKLSAKKAKRFVQIITAGAGDEDDDEDNEDEDEDDVEIDEDEDVEASDGAYYVRCAAKDPSLNDLCERAVKAGWPRARFEKERNLIKLREGRNNNPIIVAKSPLTATPKVLEAALFKSLGDPFNNKTEVGIAGERHAAFVAKHQKQFDVEYTDQTQQTAHTMYREGLSLRELVYVCAGHAGYKGSPMPTQGNIKAMLETIAHAGTIQASDGFSTASLANVVSNVANKYALAGYMYTEQAWREISEIIPTSDYKLINNINLLMGKPFEKMPADGTLSSLTLRDQVFTNKAELTGQEAFINIVNIVNDDTSILSRVPIMMGRNGGLAINRDFWGHFNQLVSLLADDGNPFWNNSSGTHGTPPEGQKAAIANRINAASYGGSTAFSATLLGAAKALLDRQVDPDGNLISANNALIPALLHPPELYQQVTSLVDPSAYNVVYGGASSARDGALNAWRGRFRPVQTAQLVSNTEWYLLSSTILAAVMQVVFLGGVETPIIQVAGPDAYFNRLGLAMRGELSFGVNRQNFRGGVRVDGN